MRLNEPEPHASAFCFFPFRISELDGIFIRRHCAEAIESEGMGYLDLQPETVEVNALAFEATAQGPAVSVVLAEDRLWVYCGCSAPKNKLCSHQAQALFNISYRNELRIFFDGKMRHEKLVQFAKPYGLQNEPCLEDHFQLTYFQRRLVIQPRLKGLQPVTPEATRLLQEQILPKQPAFPPAGRQPSEQPRRFVVLRKARFSKQLCFELYEAPVTQTGKIKNPLTLLDPLDLVWREEERIEIRFFTALSRFQNKRSSEMSPADLEALKAIVRNPLGLDFFCHDPGFSEKVVAGSLSPVWLGKPVTNMTILVDRKEAFFEVGAFLTVEGQAYPVEGLTIALDFFIAIDGRLHLARELHYLRLIAFLQQNGSRLLIHQSKYPEFQKNVLAPLEDRMSVAYAFYRQPTPQQLEQAGLQQAAEKIIYLSDLDNYVLINPVMKYGSVEVPLFSQRQIHASDAEGQSFTFHREEQAELQFASQLLQQHPHFSEQLEDDLPYLYLHRHRFLNEDWFLQAFDQWQAQGITILGFNQLKGNKRNPHKARITIRVTSGIDWFHTQIHVQFGKKKASLKQLQKSVANKNRFVRLDDGTEGILPQEWLEKFAAYFEAGEVVDENLLTPKISFSAVAQLYEAEMIDAEVKAELATYQLKLSSFENIAEVEVPAQLQATLRPYQRQGLNWLNFLDGLNFGGCLADDMGLGKSVQIIAFLLHQREKIGRNTNLIVAPTSLLFHWRDEIEKFAPSLKVVTFYGAGRNRNHDQFPDCEVVLTSYGTLVSDIAFLKKFAFNYVIADESQHIKNPSSQRYQAVRLLKARNRIVLTGTPVENHTFDLYGQLSFACPGLLGNQQFFRDTYAIPIDKFKDRKRAAELQQKVSPFILRRTKKQVAPELPPKTEMVLYCEMGAEQRAVYDAYEKEFHDYLVARTDEEMPKSSMHVLRSLTRLRQICNSPVLLQDEKVYGDVSAKMEVLMEQLEDRCGDHKILVFSQFVSMLNLVQQELEKRGIGFVSLTGSTRNREAVVDRFQKEESVRVFLISLKAGGTGLNLTEADYVYLIDPWWNPAVENQAIDRCYRIGQQSQVVAVRLICPGTVEEKMVKLQQTKKELVDDLIRTDGSLFKSLSRQDLLSLLAEPGL